MAVRKTSKFCSVCERKVAAERDDNNHILHFVLTLLTAGFWLIIWFFSILFLKGPWRCPNCGTKV